MTYRILVYSGQWRDVMKNGVKVGVEQVLLAKGAATRPRGDALRIMNFLRKRGKTFTFIERAGA